MLKVYLSSTYEDLRATRETVYKALRKIRCDVIAMEDYVAQGVAPLQKCRADVRSCDIYVGIIGWRYGYVPPGETLSITELEFQETMREPRKECLLFLADESFKPADVDLGELTKIKALRARLQKDFLVGFFGTAEQLATDVVAAVARRSIEIADAIGAMDATPQRVVEELRRLLEIRKLTPDELQLEVAHLQWDATSWLSQPDGLGTARIRLDEARRLIAYVQTSQQPDVEMLSLLGYVEKTQWQICAASSDRTGYEEALAKAGRYFRAALDLDRANVGALNGMVDILIETKAYDRAVVLGRVVTQLSPSYAAAFWDLGIALLALIKKNGSETILVDEAIDVYTSLLKLLRVNPAGFSASDRNQAEKILADLKRNRKDLTASGKGKGDKRRA
jgi:tetratricopeptide (TPR) repeat protein